MLTKVILDGPMGKRFGQTWELAVESATDALRLIDANSPGLFQWIKGNLSVYSRYRVTCEYENGTSEDLSEENYAHARKPTMIRFTPIIEGAGKSGVLQTVIGIILIAYACYTGDYTGFAMKMGVQMLIGGVAAMLAPKPNLRANNGGQNVRADKTSYFFDGPVNTTMQGIPVSLIYGRCMVGSHVISAAVTVDQLA